MLTLIGVQIKYKRHVQSRELVSKYCFEALQASEVKKIFIHFQTFRLLIDSIQNQVSQKTLHWTLTLDMVVNN